MKKEFEKNGIDIDDFSREKLDEIGNILTLNTETEGIKGALYEAKNSFTYSEIETLIDIRKKNSSLFSKWQSLSLKIMNELIPQMYAQPKEQMQLLTEMGVFKFKSVKFKNSKYIPVDEIIKDIYNPVVVRSVRTTIKMINETIKKYGYPDNIIIEMPRDKNSTEEKERIKKEQSKNEKEYEGILKRIKDEYDIEINRDDYRKQEKLALKLKLWNEQEGRCPYS